MRPDATPAQLRQAYRRKALDAHPDRRVDGAPAAVMAAINEAWTVLGDPKRRAEYDRLLAEPAPAPPPSPPRPPRHATAARQAAVEDDAEPGWVDHTGDLRRFRMLITGVVVLLGLIMLLVFVFIIWPQSA